MQYIKQLLEGLGTSDADVRFNNARHLLHIAQGQSAGFPSPARC
jgi:hypothetical protein